MDNEQHKKHRARVASLIVYQLSCVFGFLNIGVAIYCAVSGLEIFDAFGNLIVITLTAQSATLLLARVIEIQHTK
jgi:hypothetical protein